MNSGLYDGVVHPALHDLGGPEADDAAGVDGGGFPGLGVASHTRAFFAHLKDAEARQFDGLAPFKRLDDQFKRPFNHAGTFLARQADFLVNGFAQISPSKGLGH